MQPTGEILHPSCPHLRAIGSGDPLPPSAPGLFEGAEPPSLWMRSCEQLPSPQPHRAHVVPPAREPLQPPRLQLPLLVYAFHLASFALLLNLLLPWRSFLCLLMPSALVATLASF